jgi:4-hydroxyphenylpyruvate dioxygenase
MSSRPDTGGAYEGFDHLELYVSNAKQAADYYCGRLGFERIGYKGLETGCRDRVSHVLKSNKIHVVLTSTLVPEEDDAIAQHVARHGDAVRVVAFAVDNVKGVFDMAVSRGAKVISDLQVLTDPSCKGSATVATVATYGNVVHTFVERSADFDGTFLPGFRAVDGAADPLLTFRERASLNFIDHVVGNQPDLGMVPAADWYEKVLQFHRFWSVDDSVMHSEYSALRSIVMADFDEKIKMPLNEPAPGKRKSQIQEYVEFHGGAGVQHVALNTDDIVATVRTLRSRGVEFLDVPATYYTDLRARLAKSPTKVQEDMDVLESLKILVDFDDKGYLLQLFTKPVEDRPTLFYEIIQRRNHQGFGVNNFKSLFESIEREQELRGNLGNDSRPAKKQKV